MYVGTHPSINSIQLTILVSWTFFFAWSDLLSFYLPFHHDVFQEWIETWSHYLLSFFLFLRPSFIPPAGSHESVSKALPGDVAQQNGRLIPGDRLLFLIGASRRVHRYPSSFGHGHDFTGLRSSTIFGPNKISSP